jgi:CheY-like chemotaxis protein
VHLPQRQSAAAEPTVDGQTRSKILVIEGDPAAYEAIRRQLDQTRYTPKWARTLEEALDSARGSRPDAIAIDVIAPGLDGWEALRALRNDPATRDVPILVVPLDGPRLGPSLDAADFWMLSRLDEAELAERLRHVVAARGAKDGGGSGKEGAHRLLLIDDDPLVHELIGKWVTDPTYGVEHAHSGAEGLEKARAHTPDLILLDLLMDGMDGFEVAVRLQHDELTRRVPIVLLTAKDLDDTDRARLRGRIAATVKKGPGVEARLSAAIDSLLLAEAPRAAVAPRGAP